MAINKEDLQFTMKIEPDTLKMQEAIRAIGKKISADQDAIKDSWSAGLSILKEQNDSLKFSEGIMSRLSSYAKETAISFDAMGIAISKVNAESQKGKDTWGAGLESLNADHANKTRHDDFIKKLSDSAAPTAYPTVHPTDQAKKGIGSTIMDALKGAFSGGGGGLNPKQLLGSIVGSALGGGGAGGAAGAGIGGAGAAMGALGPIGTVLTATAAAVKAALSAVAGGLQELQGPLGPLGAILSAVPLVGGELKEILTSLAAMAGKASPALFKQWQMALDDVQGVIGHTFLPALDLMRDAVRFFGDVLATMLPSTREMTQMLMGLKAQWEDLKKILGELATDPVMKAIVTTQIQLWVGIVQVFVAQIKLMALSIQAALGPITALTRLLGISPGTLQSSLGAAARQAQIQGPEEYQRQLQLAAFSESPGIDAPQQTVNVLTEILSFLRTNWPTGQNARNVASDVNNVVSNGPGSWARTFLESIPGLENTTRIPGVGGV